MPYFHATRRANLPSIYRHGLGGVDHGPVSEECERGVYLASDPRLSLTIMVIHMLNLLEDEGALAPTPKEEMEQWVVVLVDDARVDPAKLRPDPQVRRWKGSWLYDGVIDVTGCVLLSVEDIHKAEEAGALPPVSDDEWIGFRPSSASPA